MRSSLKYFNNYPRTPEHKQESLSMSVMSSLLCSWPGKYPCAAFPQEGITHTSPQTCSLLAGFLWGVVLFDFPVKDLSRAEVMRMRMNAALFLSILGFGLVPLTLRPGCFLNSTLRESAERLVALRNLLLLCFQQSSFTVIKTDQTGVFHAENWGAACKRTN